MKKRFILITLFTVLLALILTACQGEKAVTGITVIGGLKYEYELGEVPDFSSVKACISFNDGTSVEVDSSALQFDGINTAIAGAQQLTIKHGGYTHTVQITVKGGAMSGSPEDIITGVSLPESLALWSTKKNDFINKNHGYVVGDDNPFYFTLKLSVYTTDGEKKNVTSYTSVSNVYLKGEEVPLTDGELSKYVSIDEEKNAFDFTEEAIGKSFVIKTRPRDCSENQIDDFTRSLDVTVVDGYNIYEAYELNYLTNSENFDSEIKIPDDSRGQTAIVDDFLKNEKNATRPENISGIVIHNDLVIKTTDIPREYFLDGNRKNELYDYISVYNHCLTEDNKTLTINGNYFAIYSYDLPPVVADGLGNQDDSLSEGQLFKFTVNAGKNANYNYRLYSTNITNLMLVDNNPQSNNIDNSSKAMRGLIAIKTREQAVTLDNINIQSYYISYYAEGDYQTVRIKDSIFYNSWQNHLFFRPENTIQGADEEPVSENYPRLTVNIESSKITSCGGPAIISFVADPAFTKNKYSGTLINISEDTVLESWVSGEEAWFTSMNISFAALQLKNLNLLVQKEDSSFIKEEIKVVNGKETTFKMMNMVMVTLMVPDLSGGWQGILDQMQGSTDIDGKLIIGNKTIMDMDDCTVDGKHYNFTDTKIAEHKAKNPESHVLTNVSGGSAYTSVGSNLTELSGDISATSDDDYLTVYFYTLGIVFGNYHSLIN
ncbi:MAG: hypothetical protein IJX92_01685 [Clostridia bacterium]|nr:hypothetical protein [Clostridia bacterium]